MKSVGSDELRQKYVACMEEIKKRTSVVTAFVHGEINSKYVVTTAESAALQLRIILELVALSSLVANQGEYPLDIRFVDGHHAQPWQVPT